MNSQWARLPTDTDVYHVIPVGDLKAHLDGRHCWCKPRIETYDNGNTLISHNAADGREFFEDDLSKEGH